MRLIEISDIRIYTLFLLKNCWQYVEMILWILYRVNSLLQRPTTWVAIKHILHDRNYWYLLYLMKLQIMQHRRQIVDNLEKELWIWRAKCRADGKNISKRLVQARAKWAFHNQGIVDFKVSLCTFQNHILLGNQYDQKIYVRIKIVFNSNVKNGNTDFSHFL